MKITEWFHSINDINCLFTLNYKNMRKTIQLLLSQINESHLILDCNHMWHSNAMNSNSTIIMPNNLTELLLLSKNLQYNFQNSKLFIIDMLPVFFSDYQGTKFKNWLTNKKKISFYICNMNSLKDNRKIILLFHSNTLNPEYPVFFDILRYYKIPCWNFKSPEEIVPLEY